MKQFNSFASFATHLAQTAAAPAIALHHGLEAVAEKIEKTAQAEIGTYQGAVGPFPAWPQLAADTQAERVALGFTANEPLLRSGQLRASYEHQVRGYEAIIGSKSDIALWQELGTSRGIPPRPVLGPAVIHNHAYIMKVLGGAAVAGVMGNSSLPQSLGYDHTV
ncbi:hypothetical protein [Burkholderia glumae]|uniref:hypothetical protein n=1 Tax=Burkholderia glumae TaxID=337 RepID=UPI0020374846|nr:hypothetical protein [Burkholderia glumae]MCM2537994.1 hypothetical protein [Burkholderia glumae]